MAEPIGRYLREHLQEISEKWEKEVLAELPSLRRLPRAALIDHLPEFLVGLAHWVEGDIANARQGFSALVEGHALTRLGHGIELATLFAEYRCLRRVILEGIWGTGEKLRAEYLIRLHDGIDLATAEAIRKFSGTRDVTRERFVGILGHDLRNPLHAVMLAAAQVTAKPCNEEKHARLSATIQRSAERMMRMIQEVIDFANAHLGEGIPSVPVACNMGEICDEAVQELRLVHPDRRILLETSGDLDGSWDRDRVMQAMSNLIGNAIEHGMDPIIVRADGTDEAVLTRVSNRGAPIPPEILPRLFDPFRRGEQENLGRGSGLGLGLYIVQQIVIAHGGTLHVHSDALETRFELRWPRVPLSKMPDRAKLA